LPRAPVCGHNIQFAGWVTALALLLYTASAVVQGTAQNRRACTPDAFRLCGAHSDVDRITACLRGATVRGFAGIAMMVFPPRRAFAAGRFSGDDYSSRLEDDREDECRPARQGPTVGLRAGVSRSETFPPSPELHRCSPDKTPFTSGWRGAVSISYSGAGQGRSAWS